MASETRRFGMHQNLLYDVILRQAGTLQKAILEGVMNAIDAGATHCAVTLDTHSFSLQDDGHGFQSRREIEDFFEMFGTPHQEGDATYGRFRMGRGQMMAFGRNTWRSRVFEMAVDIKGSGLDYDLTEHAEDDFAGTRIAVDLYDPIVPSDLERIKAELRNFVAWAQIPVTLNGDRISKRPEESRWDFEDENAYYKLSADRSQLAIYNLGVLVTSAWAGRFGMGGTIVSKKQLEVNFARNDVQSTCPVFRKISAHIRREAGEGVRKKTRLTDAERDMMVRDFLAGGLDCAAALDLRAITDGTGRNWPLKKLARIEQNFGGRLVVTQRGDQMIETAQRRGIAFSIDESTLERFGASDGEDFVKRVLTALTSVERPVAYSRAGWDLDNIGVILRDKTRVVERDDLRAFVSDDHIALETSEMTPELKLLMAAIGPGYRRLVDILNRAGYEDLRFSQRKLALGRSETALAWTDGRATIWIDTEHARLLRRGYAGAYRIAATLLHEMLHDGPDTGTHQHDHAFYQAFHDLSSGLEIDPVGQAAERMVTMFTTRLRQDGRKVSKSLLKSDDVDAAIAALRDRLDAEEAGA